MKLEDQVCSLELAKKLKELGVKQDSLHYWQWVEAHDNYELDNGKEEGKISAFTVAELGEGLPAFIDKDGVRYYLKSAIRGDGDFRKYDLYFKADFLHGEQGAFALDVADKFEADARAKIRIYLIEQGLLKP